jgi:hypothetical protein
VRAAIAASKNPPAVRSARMSWNTGRPAGLY